MLIDELGVVMLVQSRIGDIELFELRRWVVGFVRMANCVYDGMHRVEVEVARVHRQ